MGTICKPPTGELSLKTIAGRIDARYGTGTTVIWYTRPEFGRDFRMGVEFLREKNLVPDPCLVGAIERTHVALGYIDLDDLDLIYAMMQGERWSPTGGARGFIKELGLHHTSMTVGDIIQMGSKFWMVDSHGFEYLGDANA